MPTTRRLVAVAALVLQVALAGCAAVMARQEFQASEFGLAYLVPQSRAELPTLAARALQAELAALDRSMGRVEVAAKAAGGAQAARVRAQAAAVRAQLDGGFRARLAVQMGQGGTPLADRIMAHARLGSLGYAPIPRVPGDDAESKAANAAIAEADLALRAAEKAAALGQMARTMAGMAGADLIDAQDTQAAGARAVAAYAAIAGARLSLDALAEAATAKAKLAAAERRLIVVAANPIVAMRTGAAAGRVAGAHDQVAAVRREAPGYLEAAAKVLTASRAIK
jgi:hypothetical protein